MTQIIEADKDLPTTVLNPLLRGAIENIQNEEAWKEEKDIRNSLSAFFDYAKEQAGTYRIRDLDTKRMVDSYLSTL